MKRPLDILPRLYLPLILLVAAAYAWRPLIGNDDFWAHAAIGRWIVEHHRIPDHTLFLWSADQPWIPHAWLTQWFFYQLMRIGGESGGPYLALIVTVIFAALPWLLLWLYYRRHFKPQALMVPLFLVAMWVSSPRYDPRPELFTAAFVTLLYLYFLNLWERPRWSRALLFGVVIMFTLWPNLHGAVAYGIVLVWVTAIADTAQALLRPDPESREGTFRLELILAIAATAAVFIGSPFHLSYWKVLVPVQSAAFSKIDEWKPFWAWPAMSGAAIACEAVLLLVALRLWSKSENKRWAQLAWLLVMAAFLLKARRNLWLMAITSLTVIVANAKPLNSEALFKGWRDFSRKIDPKNTDDSNDIPDPMRLIVRGSLMLLLGMAVAFATPSDWLPFRAVSKKLPVQLAEFVATKTKGRVFNDYENSAYYEWHFKDKRPIYIDLNNVYPDSLMNEYFDIITMGKGYMEILDKRGVQTIALRPKMLDSESLPLFAKKLDQDARWKRVYTGKDGSVWVRRSAK